MKIKTFNLIISILTKGLIGLFFLFPTLTLAIGGIVAIIDAIFVGRFGVAIVMGLSVAFGVNFVIEKKVPELYRRMTELEGVNFWLPITAIGFGYTIWILLEGVLPPISSKTSLLINTLHNFVNESTYFSWLFRSPCDSDCYQK